MQFPVKLFHSAAGLVRDPQTKGMVQKILYARNGAELAGLKRLGWQILQEPNTIEGAGKAEPVADLVKRG